MSQNYQLAIIMILNIVGFTARKKTSDLKREPYFSLYISSHLKPQ